MNKPTYEELAAQVEMLQKHIESVALCYYNNTGNEPSLSVFHRALDEAESAVFKEPQQCLAEIRAEAGRAGWLACFDVCERFIDRYYAGVVDKCRADEYAAKIRQGGSK